MGNPLISLCKVAVRRHLMNNPENDWRLLKVMARVL